MAGRQPCWRCLQRLTLSPGYFPRPSLPKSAAFSTSASLSKVPNVTLAKGQTKGQRKPVMSKTLRLGKKKRVEKTGKPPAPGERKAIRKRIVLSNTNALEVDGLADWDTANYADPELAGSMVGLPGPVVDSLRAVEGFQATQGWGFFKRPATLIRKETMAIAKHVQDCTDNTDPKTFRRIIVGERGAGKSVLLLQAQALAFQAGWVVIHIPNGQDLISALTAYAPIPDTQPVKYIQPDYTAALLSRIATANDRVLSRLQLTQQHDLPITLQPNITLAQFADMGAQDPSLAWPIFKALWREFTAPSPTGRRPPVLLSLDGLAHVSRLSHYLAPSMHNIHAIDFSLVDHFFSHLSGAAAPFPQGGMVLAADSASNRPSSPSLDLAIRQSEAQAEAQAATGTHPALAATLPLYDPLAPYAPHDPRVLEPLRGVGILRVPALSRPEARVLLEYFAESGMLRGAVTEALVTEKWTVAGGGVVGELERGVLKSGL